MKFDFLKNKEGFKEPWQIAASRYFVENSEGGFTHAGYKEFIQSRYNVGERHLNQFFEETIQSPSGRRFSRSHSGGSWTPPLELVSAITDYDELVEARKTSKEAKKIALWSIWIAIVVGVLQIAVGIFQIISLT